MKCKALCLCGVTMLAASVGVGSLAFASEPTKPPTDAAKDALKKGTDAAKDAAKQAQKSAEDAVKKAAGGGAPEMDPEMAKVMERWMEFSTPGEHHKHLAQWAGEWDGAIKMWMDPSAPPLENKASASSKLVMGDRYLVEYVKGNFDFQDGQGPQPFEGMATMGYDNNKKMYFSTWIDNMGTSIMEEWGTCDGSGKVLTTEGKTYDPMVGAERASKSVATVVDANTRKLEMFAPGPDGKMFKNMEITYTRKK